MDSNASNNIYFRPSYRTTRQGEQQSLSSAQQRLQEFPEPSSDPKFSCGCVMNGEAAPWNSYIRSEPQEDRRWKMDVPGTGCRREGSSLAPSTRVHIWLPLLLTEPQSPIPSPKHQPGEGKGGQDTELGVRNSSRHTDPASQVCREAFGFCSLGITKRRHAEPGLSRVCEVLDIQSLTYEDFIQSPTY